MTAKWIRTFRLLGQNLSVRAGLFCIGAVVAALLAVTLSRYVPDNLADLLGGQAVDDILRILASSMLAVVTFSLSTLIASYSMASATAPPRATAVIMSDKSAQNALSMFLGAFIFSVVALVALSTHYYGPKGRVILFVTTVLVMTAVIWTIIRWIGRLSGIGQLANVIRELEKSATESIKNQCHYFRKSSDACTEAPPYALPLLNIKTGFLQTIDLKSLSKIAKDCGAEVWLKVHAGRFVYPGAVLAKYTQTNGSLSEKELNKALLACFITSEGRTFEDDPRFGIVVLSEIASRALSPGINDPGTAISVISSQLRLISKIHEAFEAPTERWWSEKLHLCSVTPEELIDDAFQAIIRDGASLVEVGIFVQKALGCIRQFPEFTDIATAYSARCLRRSTEALGDSEDKERLKRAAPWL